MPLIYYKLCIAKSIIGNLLNYLIHENHSCQYLLEISHYFLLVLVYLLRQQKSTFFTYFFPKYAYRITLVWWKDRGYHEMTTPCTEQTEILYNIKLISDIRRIQLYRAWNHFIEMAISFENFIKQWIHIDNFYGNFAIKFSIQCN